MKTIFKIFLIQVLLLNSLNAQDIYVEIKNEVSITDAKYTWFSSIIDESEAYETEHNFSVGLSGRLNKRVFIKTTFGSNDFKSEVDLYWRSDGVNLEILGWISVDQSYLEILPELRFFKSNWLYFNMGMGFNKVKSAKLTEGFYRRDSEVFYGNDNFPDFEGKYEYFVGHLGVNVNLSKIGIVLEYGYRTSGFTKAGSETPGIGINQQSFKFGVRYRIK